MEYTILGRTKLRVSRVGLGTGGKSLLGQKKGYTEAESHRVVHKALDLGVNLFDTSPAYLESEAILGRALQSAKVKRKVYLTTKVVTHQWQGAIKGPLKKAQEITASVERSLKRLAVETLDIVLFHGVLPEDYPAVTEQLYPSLTRLKETGKIGFVGISEQAVADPRHITISQAIQTDLFDVVMLRYTMVHQKAEKRIFPITKEKGIGVMSVCPADPPLCRPIQLREWLEGLKSEGKLRPEALSAEDPVRGWIEDGAEALAASAMQYVASQPAVDHIVTGTSDPDHLVANVNAALGSPMPPKTAIKLRQIYGELAENRLQAY